MADLLTNDDIQTINIEETLQNSYLDYSMSVIVGRALPDVRDVLGSDPYFAYLIGVFSVSK